MNRPKKHPPKFKVGDKVTVLAHHGIWTVERIISMTDEWLVRTAFAAGYYGYHLVCDDSTSSVKGCSENTLALAVIEQLGKISEESE